MTEHSEPYTAEDLVEIATEARLEVSTLQVGEWHRAGLLPDPVQPPGPKRRGRPRLLFPEPTPNAVCGLARWRRFVNGNENARGWLWLEGYDHLDLDPDREFAAWLKQEWAAYRKTCPSLPESPETPIDAERRDQILEELDKNYTKPESEKHGVPVEWFAVHPALLGIVQWEEYQGEEWQKLEELGFEEDDDTSPKPLLAGVYEAGEHIFGELPYSQDEMLAGPSGNPRWLAAVGLPGLAREPIDWACVRAIWQFVCIVTNIYEIPEFAERLEFPGWRLLARLLRKFRYHAYSHFEPWYMAAVLATVSKALSGKLRREIVQALEEFRRERDRHLASAEE